MPITILEPRPIPQTHTHTLHASDSDSDSDSGGVELDGDVVMTRASKGGRNGEHEIVTPGEVITDDPQWMR